MFCSGTEPFGTLVLPREKPRCVFFTVAVVSDLRSDRGKKKKRCCCSLLHCCSPFSSRTAGSYWKTGSGQAPCHGMLRGFGAEARLQRAIDSQRHFYTQAPVSEKSRFMPRSYVFYGFPKVCDSSAVLHVAFRTAEQQTRDFTGQKLVPSDGRGHPKQ